MSLDIRKVWQRIFGVDPVAEKKTGPEQYRVRCPFHKEIHDSCDVSMAKNAFYCRSCEAKGGVLDILIREQYARTRQEAMQWLNDRGLA